PGVINPAAAIAALVRITPSCAAAPDIEEMVEMTVFNPRRRALACSADRQLSENRRNACCSAFMLLITGKPERQSSRAATKLSFFCDTFCSAGASFPHVRRAAITGSAE